MVRLLIILITGILLLCSCKKAYAKGGSTQRYEKREPAPKLDELRMELYDALFPQISATLNDTEGRQQAVDITRQSLQTMNDLSKTLPGLFNRIPGLIEKQDSMTDEYLDLNRGYVSDTDRYLDYTRSGEIPEALRENMYKDINDNINRSIGTSLNELGYGGTVGSSSFNSAVDTIGNDASDAMAGRYLDTYGRVADNWSRGLASKLQGVNAFKSGLDTVGNQISGTNDMITNTNQSIQTLGDTPAAAWKAYLAPAQPAYNFWRDWQTSYDAKEDYDTVVKQGK